MKDAEDEAGRRIATVAEALYLANLLIAPGIAFVLQLWWWRRHARSPSSLARVHLRQTLAGSLWAGGLLVGVNVAILAFGGLKAPATWVTLVLYFTTCHSTLVFFGIVGLAKAMASQPWRFPLIGPR